MGRLFDDLLRFLNGLSPFPEGMLDVDGIDCVPMVGREFLLRANPSLEFLGTDAFDDDKPKVSGCFQIPLHGLLAAPYMAGDSFLGRPGLERISVSIG